MSGNAFNSKYQIGNIVWFYRADGAYVCDIIQYIEYNQGRFLYHFANAKWPKSNYDGKLIEISEDNIKQKVGHCQNYIIE